MQRIYVFASLDTLKLEESALLVLTNALPVILVQAIAWFAQIKLVIMHLPAAALLILTTMECLQNVSPVSPNV
jgi:hypothetical protein